PDQGGCTYRPDAIEAVAGGSNACGRDSDGLIAGRGWRNEDGEALASPLTQRVRVLVSPAGHGRISSGATRHTTLSARSYVAGDVAAYRQTREEGPEGANLEATPGTNLLGRV